MTLNKWLCMRGNSQARLAILMREAGYPVTIRAISYWVREKVPSDRLIHLYRATNGEIDSLEPPESEATKKRPLQLKVK